MSTPMWATAIGIPDLPDAACKGRDPYMWEVRTRGPGRKRVLDDANRLALLYCATCPVQAACRALPDMWREDIILGGIAYGALGKNNRPTIIGTAQGVAA